MSFLTHRHIIPALCAAALSASVTYVLLNLLRKKKRSPWSEEARLKRDLSRLEKELDAADVEVSRLRFEAQQAQRVRDEACRDLRAKKEECETLRAQVLQLQDRLQELRLQSAAVADDMWGTAGGWLFRAPPSVPTSTLLECLDFDVPEGQEVAIKVSRP